MCITFLQNLCNVRCFFISFYDKLNIYRDYKIFCVFITVFRTILDLISDLGTESEKAARQELEQAGCFIISYSFPSRMTRERQGVENGALLPFRPSLSRRSSEASLKRLDR